MTCHRGQESLTVFARAALCQPASMPKNSPGHIWFTSTDIAHTSCEGQEMETMNSWDFDSGSWLIFALLSNELFILSPSLARWHVEFGGCYICYLPAELETRVQLSLNSYQDPSLLPVLSWKCNACPASRFWFICNKNHLASSPKENAIHPHWETVENTVYPDANWILIRKQLLCSIHVQNCTERGVWKWEDFPWCWIVWLVALIPDGAPGTQRLWKRANFHSPSSYSRKRKTVLLRKENREKLAVIFLLLLLANYNQN